LLDAGMLGVRDRHAAADAGTAQLFALHDGFDDALKLAGGDVASLEQRLDHLANDTFLVETRQFGADRLATDEVGKLHRCVPFWNSYAASGKPRDVRSPLAYWPSASLGGSAASAANSPGLKK